MRWRSRFAVAMATAAAVEVGLITTARPFTARADVVVSIALAAMLGVVLLQRSPRAPALLARRGPADEPAGSRIGWPWVAVVVVIVGWELVNFFGSPRDDHPTLSYFSDLITVHPLGRALMFAGWLALGGYLATA